MSLRVRSPSPLECSLGASGHCDVKVNKFGMLNPLSLLPCVLVHCTARRQSKQDRELIIVRDIMYLFIRVQIVVL